MSTTCIKITETKLIDNYVNVLGKRYEDENLFFKRFLNLLTRSVKNLECFFILLIKTASTNKCSPLYRKQSLRL